jgi:hypothetical protein
MNRPNETAPGGMRGATRMHDPSEAEHDRLRRRVMNIAFVVICALNFAQWRWIGVHGRGWLSVLLLVIAAMPSGMAVKVFELRFKMAEEERQRALREIPAKQAGAFVLYALFTATVFVLNFERVTWALFGIWLYDFVTYYHDRPERIRHLYAVTKTLDELREFPAPWAWALPALVFEAAQWLL